MNFSIVPDGGEHVLVNVTIRVQKKGLCVMRGRSPLCVYNGTGRGRGYEGLLRREPSGGEVLKVIDKEKGFGPPAAPTVIR